MAIAVAASRPAGATESTLLCIDLSALVDDARVENPDDAAAARGVEHRLLLHLGRHGGVGRGLNSDECAPARKRTMPLTVAGGVTAVVVLTLGSPQSCAM